MTVGALIATIVNMNQPGRYLHWSIFTVSVANLVIIAVMVAIFGLALLIPFPGGKKDHDETLHTSYEDEGLETTSPRHTSTEEDRMWTARVRRKALKLLP